jgi:hypothetical protein
MVPNMLKPLTTFFGKISVKQKQAISWFFLQIIFVLGIGMTSVIAKIFQVKFMKKKKGTTWTMSSKDSNPKAMY